MQSTLTRHFPAILLSILTTLSATAWAQTGQAGQSGQSGQGGPSDQRQGPPAEAIAACKALKANDACSFSGQRGNVSGSCWGPEGKPLACRPKDAPNNARPNKPSNASQ